MLDLRFEWKALPVDRDIWEQRGSDQSLAASMARRKQMRVRMKPHLRALAGYRRKNAMMQEGAPQIAVPGSWMAIVGFVFFRLRFVLLWRGIGKPFRHRNQIYVAQTTMELTEIVRERLVAKILGQPKVERAELSADVASAFLRIII